MPEGARRGVEAVRGTHIPTHKLYTPRLLRGGPRMKSTRIEGQEWEPQEWEPQDWEPEHDYDGYVCEACTHMWAYVGRQSCLQRTACRLIAIHQDCHMTGDYGCTWYFEGARCRVLILFPPRRCEATSQKRVHPCHSSSLMRESNFAAPRIMPMCQPAKLRAPSSVTRLPPKDRASTEELARRDLASSATPLSPIEFLPTTHSHAGGRVPIERKGIAWSPDYFHSEVAKLKE